MLQKIIPKFAGTLIKFEIILWKNTKKAWVDAGFIIGQNKGNFVENFGR